MSGLIDLDPGRAARAPALILAPEGPARAYAPPAQPCGRLTCDQLVTYLGRRGRGVQGPRRSDPAEPARRAVPGGRADAQRARGALPDDALRRDEAPAATRGGGPGGDQAARPREASLPEPGPDPADPRPVGQQVRRALGGRAQRPQARAGEPHGEDFRDLHPHHARAPLGGDHRQRDQEQVPVRLPGHVGLDARLPGRDEPPGRPRAAGGGRDPRGRPAAPAGPDHDRALERRREARGNLAGHLGDRAGRRLLPADRDPRPAARGREPRALRRLADDPVRPEDLAGDRRAAHHARDR